MPIPLGNFISDEVYNKKLKSVHKINDISCVSFVDVDKGTEESCGKSWTVCSCAVSLTELTLTFRLELVRGSSYRDSRETLLSSQTFRYYHAL